jgi:hypothetical protein
MLIENDLKSQHALYEGLEPKNECYIQRKEAAFAASIPDWLRTIEAVRTWISLVGQDFYVPNLS